jgi:hypothetical protein
VRTSEGLEGEYGTRKLFEIWCHKGGRTKKNETVKPKWWKKGELEREERSEKMGRKSRVKVETKRRWPVEASMRKCPIQTKNCHRKRSVLSLIIMFSYKMSNRFVYLREATKLNVLIADLKSGFWQGENTATKKLFKTDLMR